MIQGIYCLQMAIEFVERVHDGVVDGLTVRLGVDIHCAAVVVVKGEKVLHPLVEQLLGRALYRRRGSRRCLVSGHDGLYFDVGGKDFECNGWLGGRGEGRSILYREAKGRIWPQAQALGCEDVDLTGGQKSDGMSEAQVNFLLLLALPHLVVSGFKSDTHIPRPGGHATHRCQHTRHHVGETRHIEQVVD